jgi:hypothetical protein
VLLADALLGAQGILEETQHAGWLSKTRNRVEKNVVGSGARMVENGSEGEFKNGKFAHVGDQRARIRAGITSEGPLFVSLYQGKHWGVRAHQHSPGRFVSPESGKYISNDRVKFIVA